MIITAVTAYKYDKDYLDDYKENLKELVDDFVIEFDADGSFLLDEGKNRQMLLHTARQRGADWVVVMDPDERLEKKASQKIKKIISGWRGERIMLEFCYRELYSPNQYRVDDMWGKKNRIFVFPLFQDNIYSDAKLHTVKNPVNEGFHVIKTGLNVYHLKHIKPELRKQRKDLYNRLDPDLKYQSIGYDYLDDETGIRLEKIPFGRTYKPGYRDYKVDPEIFL